jgi:NADH-quinone oxidoreductase subunit C
MDTNSTLAKLKQQFPQAVIETHEYRGDATAIVKKEHILPICRFLRDDPEQAYNFMIDLTAVDYMGKEPRFEVVYHLYSLSRNERLRIKSGVPESDCTIDSIVPIWIAADWFERETFDLYGIVFKGHPNLKRILLYEGFKGHPLRKDYPIRQRQPLIGPDN